MITYLKTLADNPALHGVDRAAEMLHEAAQMLYDDAVAQAALEKRRTADATRQRRFRNVSSVTSRDQRDGSSLPPTPPLLTPTTQHSTPRDVEYEGMVERLQVLLHSQVGDHCWEDVDAFVMRREYRTWASWLKEMLTLLTGGKAIPEDLARACRDDGALKEPIGTPKGLRTFVASAIAERLAPSSSPAPRRGGVAQRTFDNGRRALEGM